MKFNRVIFATASMLTVTAFVAALGARAGQAQAIQTAAASTESQGQLSKADEPNEWFSFWADPETGCEYVIYRGTHITPRLSTDGSPKGCRD